MTMTEASTDTKNLSFDEEIKRLATRAEGVQNASNLTGVVRSFAEDLVALRRLLETRGVDYTQHCITRMWVSKIQSLVDSPDSIMNPKVIEDMATILGRDVL